jgi:hypothetical protein
MMTGNEPGSSSGNLTSSNCRYFIRGASLPRAPTLCWPDSRQAEAEFTTDEAAQSFLLPRGAIAEVTDDARFTGGNLVRARRHDLPAWLAEYGIDAIAGDAAETGGGDG